MYESYEEKLHIYNLCELDGEIPFFCFCNFNII